MSDPTRAYERAEEQLESDYLAGFLSLPEYNAELRALAADYRDEAEQAALERYHDELDGWGF